MTVLTKENLSLFLENYHYFHDSYILDLNYDFRNSKIEMLIDVFWSGKPILKDNGKFETNRTQIKMYFYNVIQYNFKEVYADYIDEAYCNFIKVDGNDCICFATDKEEPLISVVCDKIDYEEIKH